MAADPSPPATPRRPPGSSGEISKQTIVISALVLVLVLVLGVAIVSVTSDGDAQQGSSLAPGELPPAEAIPRPGSGRAPEQAGDRGGSLQLGLFGVMAAGMLFIGVRIFRGGGRQAKANRARWQAAAESGRDGAVAPDRTDDPARAPAPARPRSPSGDPGT